MHLVRQVGIGVGAFAIVRADDSLAPVLAGFLLRNTVRSIAVYHS